MRSGLDRYLFNRWTIIIWFALGTFILTVILSGNRSFTEKVYSQGIYPVIATIISALSKHTSFSLDDYFYFFFFTTIVVLVILTILKRLRPTKLILITINLLAAIYILFYWLWGFNYLREDLHNRLQITSQKPGKEDFLKIMENLVSNTNATYTQFDGINYEEIDIMVETSYENLKQFLKIDYPSGKRRPKPITFSHFFAQAGISGYFGPFFNEIHLNRNLLPVEYPVVLAHEKAHQFGITGEGEANFYAWLICSSSNSKHLRYSANIYILSHFLYQTRKIPEAGKVIQQIDEKVRTEFKNIEKHWATFRNKKIEGAAGKMNDIYLKTNRIETGIGDYSGVVKYVIDFSLDSLAQSRLKINPSITLKNE